MYKRWFNLALNQLLARAQLKCHGIRLHHPGLMETEDECRRRCTPVGKVLARGLAASRLWSLDVLCCEAQLRRSA